MRFMFGVWFHKVTETIICPAITSPLFILKIIFHAITYLKIIQPTTTGTNTPR